MAINLSLGLNNGIDYEVVWNGEILGTLINRYKIQEEHIRSYNQITTIEDLIGSILFYLRDGKGGAVHVADIAIIHEFSKFFEYNLTIGGAGTRAAIVLDKLGIQSNVHLVSNNDVIQERLPKTIKVFCGNENESFYPHLIIQFPIGGSVKTQNISITTQRANRIMYIHNPDIDNLPLSEDFFKAAGKTNVMLIGGFTSMSDLDEALVRVAQASKYIDSYITPQTLVYYENSSPPRGFKKELLQVWRLIVAKSQIFGLNEDELQLIIQRTIDITDPSQILCALNDLSTLIPCKNYVIHTKYWALAYGDNPDIYESSLRSGIGLATTRLCHGDAVTQARVDEIMGYPLDPIGDMFAQSINSSPLICCVPSFLVKQKNLTTVGLGDTFVAGFVAELSDKIDSVR